ncbi:MAG TPA: Gp49 family protein [Paucimonas sp.]|nr:Gp49 family protein [Paucimonas sp.]
MSEYGIEQDIRAKGLTAPRITPQRVEEVIMGEDYHVFPGTTLTVCCLMLANGFNVIGESACASLANFDAELGRKIARDNAKQKIWALEGYALRNTLHGQQAA